MRKTKKRGERYPPICPKCGEALAYIKTKWGYTALSNTPVGVVISRNGKTVFVMPETGEVVRGDRHVGGMTLPRAYAYIPHFTVCSGAKDK